MEIGNSNLPAQLDCGLLPVTSPEPELVPNDSVEFPLGKRVHGQSVIVSVVAPDTAYVCDLNIRVVGEATKVVKLETTIRLAPPDL